VAEACNGFGKTVCVLSALLPLGRKVIYATRTHEQVRQVLEEMKRINRKAGMKYSSVNLASRQHLCLDPRCSKLSPREGLEACRVLREEEKCSYQWEVKNLPSTLPPVLSINALRREGKINGLCPYFLARKAAETCNVVVAPYQYVFDKTIREKVGLQLSGKILVFDEAHNADTIALEVLSDTLSDRVLNQADNELKAIGKTTDLLDDLHRYVEENVLEDEVSVKPGAKLYEDLKNILEVSSISSFVDSYSKIVDKIRDDKMERGEYPVCYLNGVLQFLSLVESSPKESYITLYRKSIYGLNQIEYRCLDPALAIKPVINIVNSVLVMSGTLSPIELFTQILGLPQAEVRTYSAIAKPDNVQCLIDPSVTTKFSKRSEAMKLQYGEKVAKTVASIPHGILIFFPQRRFMMNAIEGWRGRGIVEQRGALTFLGGKRLFVEGSTAVDNRRVVEEYKMIAEDQGAVLCCVFRGRNAEGSNFPDEQARGVILVGVPYADFSDPVVKAQIDYLNHKQKGLGDQWYVMDAFKAANQAIGRGIRHRDDWCHFILMDQRYKTYHRLLSNWVLAGGVESTII